jgi:hypothetical protein
LLYSSVCCNIETESLHDTEPVISVVARNPKGGNSTLDDIVIDIDTSPSRNPLSPSPKPSSRKGIGGKDNAVPVSAAPPNNKGTYVSLFKEPSDDNIEEDMDMEMGDLDMSAEPSPLFGEC